MHSGFYFREVEFPNIQFSGKYSCSRVRGRVFSGYDFRENVRAPKYHLNNTNFTHDTITFVPYNYYYFSVIVFLKNPFCKVIVWIKSDIPLDLHRSIESVVQCPVKFLLVLWPSLKYVERAHWLKSIDFHEEYHSECENRCVKPISFVFTECMKKCCVRFACWGSGCCMHFAFLLNSIFKTFGLEAIEKMVTFIGCIILVFGKFNCL